MSRHRPHVSGALAGGLALVVSWVVAGGCGRPVADPAVPVSPTSRVATATASGSAAAPLASGRTAGSQPAAGRATVQAPIPAGPADLFEDVTARAGIGFVHQLCDDHVSNILESNGAGGAVLDVDRDGFMDLFLVNSGPLQGVTRHAPGTVRQPNRLYRNRGDGTFEDRTQGSGLEGDGYGTAAAAADFDKDGRTDLYVVNVGRNRLYRNRGDGTFEDVTARAGVGNEGTGIGAVFADVDGDGWLDLFVANYLTFDPQYRLFFQPDGFPNALAYAPEFNVLYRNRGDGTFEDVSEASGIRIPGHRAMSVTAADLDLDGDTDFYLSNDLSANLLLLNDGRGRFSDVATKVGVAFNALGEAAGSMGAAVGDANGDGRPDILVTRFGYGSLYLGDAKGLFADHMMASGLGALTAQYVAWGGVFLDFDNDRDEDVFIANGDAHYLVGWPSLLLENRGNGTFADAADLGGAVFHAKLRGRAAAALDFDNDGRVDLLMTGLADRPLLLRNRSPVRKHWLTLRLEGSRANRDGFGAQVRVTAGGRTTVHLSRAPTSFLMQGDPRIHVGLGDADRVTRLEVLWPGGRTQTLDDVPADQVLDIREPDSEARP